MPLVAASRHSLHFLHVDNGQLVDETGGQFDVENTVVSSTARQILVASMDMRLRACLWPVTQKSLYLRISLF